jgi:hypothetical protein
MLQFFLSAESSLLHTAPFFTFYLDSMGMITKTKTDVSSSSNLINFLSTSQEHILNGIDALSSIMLCPTFGKKLYN